MSIMQRFFDYVVGDDLFSESENPLRVQKQTVTGVPRKKRRNHVSWIRGRRNP